LLLSLVFLEVFNEVFILQIFTTKQIFLKIFLSKELHEGPKSQKHKNYQVRVTGVEFQYCTK